MSFSSLLGKHSPSYGEEKDEGKNKRSVEEEMKRGRMIRNAIIALLVVILVWKTSNDYSASSVEVGVVYHVNHHDQQHQQPDADRDGFSSSSTSFDNADVDVSSTEDVPEQRAGEIDFEKFPVIDKRSQIFMGHKSTNTGWIVDTRCFSKERPLIVYGVGAGEDISWDVGMVERFGAQMYIFDPTEKSIRYVTPIVEKHADHMTFTPEGLSTEKGVLKFTLPQNPKHVSMRAGTHSVKDGRIVEVPVNSLKNWMERFGHTYLDVLKIDIEGSEYGVLQQLIDEDYMPFTQILIEFHDRWLKPSQKNKHRKVWEGLKRLGFVPYAQRHSNQEVSWIKKRDLPYCLGANMVRSPYSNGEGISSSSSNSFEFGESQQQQQDEQLMDEPTPSKTTSTKIKNNKMTIKGYPVIDKSAQIFMGHKSTNTGWIVDTRCFNRKPLIAYGVGAGEDISWDVGMAQKYGAQMYVFDPTPKSIRYVTPIIEKHSDKMTFTPEGLSTEQGTLKFTKPDNPKHVSMRVGEHSSNNKRIVEVPVNTLRNWMERFGHTYLDVLKIDIEGSEYGVLQQLIDEDYMPFTQLLIEFHDRWFQGAGKEKHKRVWDGLLRLGFQPFAQRHSNQEVSFIKVKDIPYCMGEDMIRSPHA